MVNSFPFAGVSLGEFTLSGEGGTGSFVAGDTFTIEVDQTVPASGTGMAVYDVTGTVSTVSASVISISFPSSPTFALPGGELYSLTSLVSLDATDSFTAPLSAAIVGPEFALPLPTPSSVWGGLSLLGLLGGASIKRLRRQAF
jgi:hypothetical protein